jgi:hypothetical protein
MNVKSPPVVWTPLLKYKLKNLKEDFQIADFERVINQGHVKKIKQAILEGTFYDNAIHVTNDKKPWSVIDGQHRLSALWLCYLENHVEEFDLMLATYPREAARIIYRRLNMGKTLQLKDHLKAMDDGKHPFFTELKPWMSHDPRPDKPVYISLLQAIHYANGGKDSISVLTLDTAFKNIKNTNIAAAKLFCEATKRHTTKIFGERLYFSNYYRNIYKFTLKYNLKEKQIDKLIKLILEDNQVQEIAQTRNMIDLVRTYEFIREKILPKVIKK